MKSETGRADGGKEARAHASSSSRTFHAEWDGE